MYLYNRLGPVIGQERQTLIPDAFNAAVAMAFIEMAATASIFFFRTISSRAINNSAFLAAKTMICLSSAWGLAITFILHRVQS
jgi:hypothetical protein